MNIVDKLIEKDWYLQGFNAVPALLYGPAWSMVRDMPSFLGFGYSACVEYFHNDTCYYFYDWQDLNNIKNELLKRFCKDKKYLSYLLKEDKKICKKILKEYKKLGKINLARASLKQLFVAWAKANDLYSKLLSVSHIVEGFTLTTEEKIINLISDEFPDNKDAILILTNPCTHTFLSIEHYELCLIARYIKKIGLSSENIDEILKNKIVYKKIKRHQEKYFWKLNSYTSAKNLDINFFAKEVEQLLEKEVDFERFISEFEKISQKNKEKSRLLKMIKNKELINLLQISEVIFTIHDRRKEYITQAITYLELVLGEIARRFNIPMEYMHYVRVSDLGELPSILEELKKRREHSVFFLSPDKEFSVLSGVEAKNYFEKISKKFDLNNVSEIKGYCASKGSVRGTVKICRGENELNKVQTGDILVACMTQPEFLPAMKKSAAVITDEGGLTCHAAIISRELGIPCVIGTKIATQVLKDGDRVEVDADNGVIKIIKNV